MTSRKALASGVLASFTEPMLLTRCDELPEGSNWLYELKLDGYRALGFKTGGKVHLRSRNGKDFNRQYPAVDPIRYSPELPARLTDLIQSIRARGLEGLVAKRRDSR